MRLVTLALFAATSFAVSPAHAQTPSTAAPPAPESLAAARQLIQVMKATDQLKALLPAIFQNFKATYVQNRPEMERNFDAMVPVFTQAADARMAEFADQIASVYARHFSADEIHQIIAFYQTPAGQKLIAEQPEIARETITAGQEFGRSLAVDIQTRAFQALQKQQNGN